MIRVGFQSANKMKNEKTEPGETPKTRENIVPAKEVNSKENFTGELAAQRWSVITFEKCAAKNLSYAEAEKKLQKLKRQKNSGLCIVSDEAAERIKPKVN